MAACAFTAVNGFLASFGLGINTATSDTTNTIPAPSPLIGGAYVIPIDNGSENLFRYAAPAHDVNLVKSGFGTMMISGTDALTGNNTVTQGEVLVNGTATMNGTTNAVQQTLHLRRHGDRRNVYVDVQQLHDRQYSLHRRCE